MQIWLQRAIIKLGIPNGFFTEKICLLVEGQTTFLWNNDWIEDSTRKIIEDSVIISTDVLDEIEPEITEDEVLLFGVQSL